MIQYIHAKLADNTTETMIFPTSSFYPPSKLYMKNPKKQTS